MEKKLSFNENADNYDRLRLRYCQELFADIAAYAGLARGCGGHWRWVQGQGRLPDPFWRGAVR